MDKNPVHIISHPLVKHKLTLMRKKNTNSGEFRLLLYEISQFLAYEISRNLPLVDEDIQTPLAKSKQPLLDNVKIAFISILRSGNGILEGMLDVMPFAHVGHIGLYREPSTHTAVEYYFKLPSDMPERDAVIIDPMLATGRTAAIAATRVKETGAKTLKFICLLASPEGIAYFHEKHPDVEIITVSVDEKLNNKKYILPGLGDVSHRMFGT
ncbi:MAG: uracil phosphoribosyltransferase [Gammaproteobacteria bacterium]